MERYGFTEMHHEYLDNLIKNFPMNDYQRQPKKNRDLKKIIKKTFNYIIMFVLVILFTLFFVSIDGIVNFILGI